MHLSVSWQLHVCVAWQNVQCHEVCKPVGIDYATGMFTYDRKCVKKESGGRCKTWEPIKKPECFTSMCKDPEYARLVCARVAQMD